MGDIVFYISAIALLPAIIYSIYVGAKVNSVFRKYSMQFSNSGMTAYEVTRKMLRHAGITDVKVDKVRGNLTDHYNPQNNTIYLSESVFSSTSVAAIGVAAHETGHAMQYHQKYFPIKVRTSLVPVVNIGSRLAIPMILFGFLISITSALGIYMLYIGLAFYALSTVFMLITLPVEFNASNRAKKALVELNILTRDEGKMASAVLNAAAKTYIASFAVSLLFLLRMVAMFGKRR